MTKSDFKPFPGAVCQRLRNLTELKKVAESKRAQLFDSRDYAEEQIRLTDGAERERHEADFGRCVLEIQRWARALKKIEGDRDTLIEHADQNTFEFDDPQVTIEEYLKSSKEEAEAEIKPAAPKPGKPRPEAPDPSLGDGVDEHLKASVNELDCNESIKAKLTNAGLTTIGRLIEAVDKGDTQTEGIYAAIENLTAKQAESCLKALRDYRTKHRKAAMAAEGGEA